MKEQLNLLERRTIEPVPDSERHGKAISQFYNTAARNFHLPAFVGGSAGIALGLGIGGSVTAIVAGCALGALVNSLCVIMGPRRGLPQMVMGRSAFGYFGEYFPAILATLIFIGYFVVNVILAERAVATLWPGVPYGLIVVVMCVLATILAVFGYDFVQSYSKWTTRATVIVFILLFVVGVHHGFGSLMTTHASGTAFWKAWMLQFVISFTLNASWAPYASDYSRYLPSTLSPKLIFWNSWAGMFLVSALVMTFGSMFLTIAPQAGVLAGIKAGAGWFAYIAILVGMIPGGVVCMMMNVYSGSLSTRSWDLRIERRILSLAVGAIGIVLGISFGGAQYFGHFLDFLEIVGYFTIPWAVVVCMDYFVKHKQGTTLPAPEAFYDWKTIGAFDAWNIAALVAGIVVAIPFMNNDFYVAPIGKSLGFDISYFISAAVTLVIYLAGLRFGTGTARTIESRRAGTRPKTPSEV